MEHRATRPRLISFSTIPMRAFHIAAVPRDKLLFASTLGK